MAGVAEISYFGQYLHVFCVRGAHRADTLGDAIRARGLAVSSVRPIAASLEDAFVRLVQKGQAA